MNARKHRTTGTLDGSEHQPRSGSSKVGTPESVFFALQRQGLLTIDHGVVVVHSESETVNVNPAAASILDLPVGQSSVVDFQSALDKLSRLTADAQSIQDQLKLLDDSPDARISKWLWHLPELATHMYVSVVPLDGGDVHGHIWVFQDVSELFNALHNVHRLELQLRQLLTEGDVLAARVRRDGVFEWVSPSTKRMLGFEDTDLVGLNTADFIHRDDRSKFLAMVRRLIQTGEPQSLGVRLRDAHGRIRHVEGRMFHAAGESDSIDTIVSDVTSRVELEELRATVTSVASHELKAPLAFMSTGLALLEAGTIDATTEQGRDIVDRMHTAADRLARMTDDLLGLQRLQLTRSAVVDNPIAVFGIVEKAAHSVQSERGIEVNVHDESHGASQLIDGDLVQQAIVNLVSNAIRHAPDHSVVDVVVGVRDDEVKITVRDRGPGIPLASRDKMFLPFVQLESDRRGSGLGLAIVKRIAHLHRGEIRMDDPEVGPGSIFTLILHGEVES